MIFSGFLAWLGFGAKPTESSCFRTERKFIGNQSNGNSKQSKRIWAQSKSRATETRFEGSLNLLVSDKILQQIRVGSPYQKSFVVLPPAPPDFNVG